MQTGILFPHQLFEQHVLHKTCTTIYLVEEYLLFSQYNFHKRKIAFHRASMKFYENYLQSIKIEVVYIEATDALSDIRNLLPYLKARGIDKLHYIDTTDDWLEQRIHKSAFEQNIQLQKHSTPLFLNTGEENAAFFKNKKRMFQADFYKYQRTSKNILLEIDGSPLGGKWSFDEENRLRYPREKTPPSVSHPVPSEFHIEAIEYTRKYFGNNYGRLDTQFIYPVTFSESKKWLKEFLAQRFADFGAYEDAIVSEEHFLHHSVLSPMLNAGLLTPAYVLDETLKFAAENDIPLNSLEGFIRQILGWREFVRAVYELKGRTERTKNFWGFTRKIPSSFWTGTTGIEPLDVTIKKVLETGYCHHIERLMLLGNFMLLCEFDPDEVYRWFMELFIDAYDWVMVTNVYGMSQFADGGIMATKPYISGSSYILKMSDYKKGEWQETWDGLFWNFLHSQRHFFLQHPRMGMLVKTFDKMGKEKQQIHLANAQKFLDQLVR